MTSISSVPALSLTLYWSESWSSPSWVSSTLRPVAFSNSGMAALMPSVQTWLARVTRNTLGPLPPAEFPPAEPHPVRVPSARIVAAAVIPAARKRGCRFTVSPFSLLVSVGSLLRPSRQTPLGRAVPPAPMHLYICHKPKTIVRKIILMQARYRNDMLIRMSTPLAETGRRRRSSFGAPAGSACTGGGFAGAGRQLRRICPAAPWYGSKSLRNSTGYPVRSSARP